MPMMAIADKGGHGTQTMHPQQMSMSALTEILLATGDKLNDPSGREYTVGEVHQIGDRFMVAMSRTK